MRGEYVKNSPPTKSTTELPPRARRIRGHDRIAPRPLGTTSACAENTCGRTENCYLVGNYLRVRGEYHDFPFCRCGKGELPPRARRILQMINPRSIEEGTTSACAENTHHDCYHPLLIRNYLRVRGEYSVLRSSPAVLLELPPRARRIHTLPKTPPTITGTTSACAENTTRDPRGVKNRRNYLRVRGEYPQTQL